MISIMVPVDGAHLDNGGFHVASNMPATEILPQADDGMVHEDLVEKIDWQIVPADVGDVVLFDSYLPHMSPTNNSQRSRRCIFLTYNLAEEGDRRQEYYDFKMQYFPPRRLRSKNQNLNLWQSRSSRPLL